MNFVHHISKGFQDIGCGYTHSITHTMAHELGHGLFGLDHIFSGAYGIKKGATYNLMDYTEKTPNDALSYHEWTQINLPLPSWSALSRAEEDMWLEERVLKAGEFVWEGDWLCGYYPDELEEKVNDLKPLFDHIRNNYASYWKDLNSKKKDLDVNGFGEWSVRKFSIKEAICKSLYEKLSKKGTPSFDLHEKGIFLQPYVMNVNGVEKSYEVSVYSFKKNVEVDCNKFKLQDLSDLADHQNVKAAYCNEYGLVALYDEGKNLNMIIQVWSKDGETPKNAAINWLNYLNIVSQSGDADAKAEENKKQTDTKINESNPTGWSIDKCKQLVQRMYDNLSEWAKGLLPEEDLPVVWGEKLPTDRYIVSDAQALIRDKNGKELEGKPKIPQGTEVKIVPNVTTTDGAYIQVEVVGSNPKQLHYTAASNLTKIEILEKPEDAFFIFGNSVKLPYSSVPTGESHDLKDEFKVIARCGDYVRIASSSLKEFRKNSEGFWIKEPKLTAAQISEARKEIEKITDADKKAEAYLKLQKRVMYKNQRNNESTLFKKDSKGKETTEKVNIGDVMCNVTCTAMALEMLGLSNPCANDIPPLQYEDCIEKNITWEHEGTFKYKPLNDGNKYDDAREWAAGRQSAVRNMFGDKVAVTTKADLSVKKDIDKIKALIMERLKLGDGVIVSYSGHFIRIKSCDDNGYYYDDPYGKYTITSTGRSWNGNYNGKTSEEGVGQNNYRRWSDFKILVEPIIFTVEYYHLK